MLPGIQSLASFSVGRGEQIFILFLYFYFYFFCFGSRPFPLSSGRAGFNFISFGS